MTAPDDSSNNNGATIEELPQEQREEIAEQVAAYEANLRQRYRRADDIPHINGQRRSFRERLIERALEDDSRDEEDVREEEHIVISSNLMLSLLFFVVFTIAALFAADHLESYAKAFSAFFVVHFSWFYMLVSTGSLVFLGYLAFSRFGPIVLGDPDGKPEFSDLSWYSMLFSAGMGVGLLFWGSAEPIKHYLSPATVPAQSAEAARWAMIHSVFHWGLHGWGIYTLCAIGVAYYGFRKRKQYLLSSSIVDVTDSRTVRKVLMVLTDLCATLAVVFGVSASLGMGVKQIAGGLNYVWQIDAASTAGLITIVTIITIAYLISATTGLDKGIKWLSNLNMGVAILLMLFVFICGPSLFQLKIFVDSIGQYLNELFSLSFKIAPFTPDYERWMGDWTLLFFTWWIAWGPFVGIFIARISKGRTIREVVLGALIVPTVFSILWFSVFGGASLHLEIFGEPAQRIGALVQQDVTVAFFALLNHYPLSKLTSAISIFLLFTFLITSADSACFTIAMMTTEGDLEPSMWMKILWGLILAVLTLILIFGGGLQAMQACVLAFAFPFSIVMILVAISVLVRLSIQVRSRRI